MRHNNKIKYYELPFPGEGQDFPKYRVNQGGENLDYIFGEL